MDKKLKYAIIVGIILLLAVGVYIALPDSNEPIINIEQATPISNIHGNIGSGSSASEPSGVKQ